MRFHHRCLSGGALLLSAAGSFGCMGVFVEGQATLYPSMKYSEESAPAKPEDRVAAGGAGGFGLGINVGFDFDGKRSTRFAAGLVTHSTSVPGGKVSGQITDFRLDFKLARLGSARRLRLGIGTGLATTNKVSMDGANGNTVTEDHNLVTNAYIGPVFAQYAGKRHEVSVMGALGYFTAAAPNGTVRGVGLGAKVTYSFHFGDTRPETFVIVRSSSSVLRPLEAGAQAIGCTTETGETPAGDDTLLAKCARTDVRFTAVGGTLLVSCRGDAEDCEEEAVEIVEAAKAAKAAATPDPLKATAPPGAEPPKTEPPRADPPKADAPPPATPMPQ